MGIARGFYGQNWLSVCLDYMHAYRLGAHVATVDMVNWMEIVKSWHECGL